MPDHWQRVNELFLAVIEQDPAARAAFLDQECAGNAELRAEVESLVAAHEQAGTFLEAPAYEVEAERPDADPGDALVGRRLGQYVVIRMLGRGGMGVVYLADDTRLGRQVAIKALAPEFSQHDKRRERLRLEARAAAALSHPGIATVYALEEFGETLYLIGEYVPGETLRDELARGPLPPGPLLDTGLQIARALAAAHDLGIVHRDLKPENVIRTPAGAIKILDFGLARFQDPAPVHGDAPRLTEEGTLLGTPAYMSPEQLRGWDVDCRADIFALGVLLYELGCGVHPFEGSDASSTVARILENEPMDAAALAPAIPPGLVRAIRRCLQKDREQRYPTARELIEDLEGTGEKIAEAPSLSPRHAGASQRYRPWRRRHADATMVVGVPPALRRRVVLRDAVPVMGGEGMDSQAMGIGALLPGAGSRSGRGQSEVASVVHVQVQSRGDRRSARAGVPVDPRVGRHPRLSLRADGGRDR